MTIQLQLIPFTVCLIVGSMLGVYTVRLIDCVINREMRRSRHIKSCERAECSLDDGAAQWLQKLLVRGYMPFKMVEAGAERAGIDVKTLDRAIGLCKATSKKYNNVVYLSLPGV